MSYIQRSYNKNISTKLSTFISSVVLSASIIGCGSSGDRLTEEEQLVQDVRDVIAAKALSGNPAAGRDLPTIDDPKAQLGMKLFFTKALGGDMDTACVTCHHPVLGGGDDLSLPVGVDSENHDLLGPGRFHSVSGEHFDGGPTVPRNAPTTFNLGLWDSVLFHDGRLQSLTGTAGMNGADGGIRTPDSAFGEADPNAGANLAVAQARFPVTSPEEMKNFGAFDGTNNTEVREFLQQRVGGYGTPPGDVLPMNQWLEEFQTAFNAPQGTAEELITFANMVEAIGTYERSQVFVDTPWKAFVDGDDEAISEEAKRGALLFFNDVASGGANCASCHSGDFFTDEGFHNIAMPQIGRGKGDGTNGNDDFGRFRETGETADMYAFRTPSLINTSATGPWGHAGAYTTLENVIRHHLDPQAGLDSYDWSQIAPNIQAVDMVANTQSAIDALEASRTAGTAMLQNVQLTDEQVSDLLAFVMALTDPCVEDRACIGQWIPDASDTNPDALRLNAVDENGDFL